MTEPTTVSRKDKPQKSALSQALVRVCSQWPALWPQWKQREFRPVAVGIGTRMREWIKLHPETDVTGKDIKRVMAFVMSRRRYHRQVTAGATRFGLDGQPAGTVTEQEAEWARKQIDVITEKRARASAARED